VNDKLVSFERHRAARERTVQQGLLESVTVDKYMKITLALRRKFRPAV
jgi:hypothetical protein